VALEEGVGRSRTQGRWEHSLRSVPTSPKRIDPPDPPSDREAWVDILQKCQDGNWWLVRTYDLRRTATVVASHLRTGLKAAPPGEWEFKHGRTEDDRWGVWARRTDVEAEV
jgi:hypothetical protein